MSILPADLQAFFAQGVSDDPTKNGGRMSERAMRLNYKNEVFPDVSEYLREQGTAVAGRRRMKIFLANRNADNTPGQYPRALIDAPTPWGDYAYFMAGTQEDFERSLTGSEPIYGAARLSANALTGANIIKVQLKHSLVAAMLVKDREILLSTRPRFEDVASTVGVEKKHVIAAAPVIAGLEATITLDRALEADFRTTAGARISTVYRPAGAMTPTLTGWTETGTGNYDEAGYPLALDNLGAIAQHWTGQYLDATNFVLSGDTVGAVGSFLTTADAIPLNPANNRPYLKLLSGGHGSAHVQGDKFSFYTWPASFAVWLDHVIPPGLTEYGAVDLPLCWSAESPT